MTITPKKIVIAVAIVIALLVARVMWVRWKNADYRYEYRIEFKYLPENDKEFAAWLRKQPGVKKASAHRERKTLVLEFDIAPDAAVPEVLRQSELLGYSERGKHSSSRERLW